LGTGEAVDGAEGRASARGLVSPEGVATGFAGLVDSVRAAGLAAVSVLGALFGADFDFAGAGMPAMWPRRAA